MFRAKSWDKNYPGSKIPTWAIHRLSPKSKIKLKPKPKPAQTEEIDSEGAKGVAAGGANGDGGAGSRSLGGFSLKDYLDSNNPGKLLNFKRSKLLGEKAVS